MAEENKPAHEMSPQPLEIIAPSALESLERANVDIQISTARRYPRSPALVKQKMLGLATLDEETAMSCFYVLRRQGKQIEGPSVRMAEIAAMAFGNLRFGARVVANDGRNVTAQGFCHDLENNVLSTMEVKRRITDKDGHTYSDDMQVVTGNAACAIAARNAIFKVIPFALIKPVFQAAKKAAVGDITTLTLRRTQMLAKFGALGVDEKRLVHAIGKAGIEEIGLPEMETLVGIYNAIRDGDQSVEEAFPPVAGSGPAKAPAPANGNGGQQKPAEEEIVIPDWRVVAPHFGRNKKPLGKLKPETLAWFQNLDGNGWQGPKPDPKTGKLSPQDAMFAKAVELSKADAPGGVPKSAAAATAAQPDDSPKGKLRALMAEAKVEEKDLLTHLFGLNLIQQGDTVDKLPEEKVAAIVHDWPSFVGELKHG
jgi:hypothetical protein